MAEDKKPSDDRRGGDRRQDSDPNFKGPERRTGDRRSDPPADKPS